MRLDCVSLAEQSDHFFARIVPDYHDDYEDINDDCDNIFCDYYDCDDIYDGIYVDFDNIYMMIMMT